MGKQKEIAIKDADRLANYQESPIVTRQKKRENNIHNALKEIQANLKAPKGQFNSFGKYSYRSAEDILEALKPLLNEHNLTLTITEQTIELGGYLILESTAVLDNGNDMISVKAQAGVNPERKGMDIAQSFGASSSYAKKYALGNLFLLDDTKDADATTKPKDVEPVKAKKKMTTDIYNAMLEYINTGKAEVVKGKLSTYKMSKKQEDTLTRMINESKQ